MVPLYQSIRSYKNTKVNKSCEPIEVLEYEWSSYGQEFWVLVDNHNGQRGWLSTEFVRFEP